MVYKIILLIPLIFITCQQKTTQSADEHNIYDNLLLDRQGGGDLEFSVFPTKSADIFLSKVSRLNYRDTLITFNLINDSTHTQTFEVLTHTLHGHWELTGDFKQDTLPAGTWVNLYMVRKGDRTEITNTDLRDILLDFEPMVRAKIK